VIGGALTQEMEEVEERRDVEETHESGLSRRATASPNITSCRINPELT
jgi:hypothetical protein